MGFQLYGYVVIEQQSGMGPQRPVVQRKAKQKTEGMAAEWRQYSMVLEGVASHGPEFKCWFWDFINCGVWGKLYYYGKFHYSHLQYKDDSDDRTSTP